MNARSAAEAGLCARCRHARRQATARGGVFWRCLRSETDDRFARYPRLPVTQCSGFEDARGAVPTVRAPRG